mgnify:CR=1 FL=1
MKTNKAILLLGGLAIAGASVGQAKEEVAIESAKKGAYTLGDFGVTGPDFVKNTEVFINGRLRFEGADQDAKSGAAVASLRNRFGLRTGKVSGFSVLAEAEHTWILSNTSDYSPFPSSSRSIIADPDNFDLNRLQLDYSLKSTDFSLGRQYINHGDQRFIGAVSWRQNDQTFDAVSVTNSTLKDLNLTYSYANQVNRIFGTNAPSGALSRWHGDVHLMRGDYSGFSAGTFSGFAYLMDFENAVAESTNTYGAEFKGSQQLSQAMPDLDYLVTGALQNGAGDNASYEEYYFRADLSMNAKPVNGGLGAEWMTGDGDNAFIFPLGTNHKFGGFADAFLTTPGSGLHDYYAWIGGKCPLEINHKVIFHHFSSDKGNDFIGYEFDYVSKKVLTENTSVLMKLAHLEGSRTVKDVQRASIQLDYSF